MAYWSRLAVGAGLEVAQVVVDRELHVHVEHPAARQQEREVGDGARRGGGLLAVADALDEAGRPQHVIGHALAPLAPGPGVGQRLAERLGRVGQPGADLGHLGEARLDPAALLGPLALERRHQLGDPAELDPHVAHVLFDGGGPQRHLVGERAAELAHPLLEGVLAGREVARAGICLGAEPLARHLDHGVDRGVDRRPHRGLVLGRPPLLVGPVGRAVGRTAGPQAHRRQPRAGQPGHEAGSGSHEDEGGFHAANPKEGV